MGLACKKNRFKIILKKVKLSWGLGIPLSALVNLNPCAYYLLLRTQNKKGLL